MPARHRLPHGALLAQPPDTFSETDPDTPLDGVQKGLLSGHPLGGWAPMAIGVADGEPASVDADLVVDELEVFLYLSELGGHLGGPAAA